MVTDLAIMAIGVVTAGAFVVALIYTLALVAFAVEFERSRRRWEAVLSRALAEQLKKRGRLVTLLVLFTIAASACAGPLSTREKGAAVGTVGGGAAGAAVGSAVGSPGTGAAIGAAVGALGGWVVGDRAQARQQAERETAGRAATPPPLPPATTAREAGDPTRGAFVNTTPWTLALELVPAGDENGATMMLSVPPQGAMPYSLDVGHYRLHAAAAVATQFGARPVGSVTKSFTVDPRGTGWRVTFNEHDFR